MYSIFLVILLTHVISGQNLFTIYLTISEIMSTIYLSNTIVEGDAKHNRLYRHSIWTVIHVIIFIVYDELIKCFFFLSFFFVHRTLTMIQVVCPKTYWELICFVSKFICEHNQNLLSTCSILETNSNILSP